MQRALSVEKRFQEELLALPRDAAKKIVRAVDELQRDPHHLSKPLQNAEGIWRREVQPYRILFTYTPDWIHVYSVQHRQGVYAGQIAKPSQGAPNSPLAKPQLKEAAIQADREQLVSVAPSVEDCWDVGRRLVACDTSEALEELIAMGIPTDIFDTLFGRLEDRQLQIARAAVRLQLVRSDVIDAFFAPVLSMRSDVRPSELLVVAPWVTPWRSQRTSFSGLLRFIARRRVRMTVLTRPPTFEAHQRALNQLMTLPSVAVSEVPDLHAKYFVCDMAPNPFALIASANLTRQSLANLEVGVFMRGVGPVEGVIRDLQSLGIDLLARGTRLKKWELQ